VQGRNGIDKRGRERERAHAHACTSEWRTVDHVCAQQQRARCAHIGVGLLATDPKLTQDVFGGKHDIFWSSDNTCSNVPHSPDLQSDLKYKPGA